MSRRPSQENLKSNGSNFTRRHKHKNDSKGNVDFSWEKHLQQTGTKAAPPHCFKHSTDENIVNKFKVGQKLEAKDARNLSAISVATIVQIQGLRLCLRLDGTDGCNDFWRLVDSKDIFPLGTCEAHGGLLQPPLGFTKKVSTWPVFLSKTLNGTCHANQSSFYPEPEGPEDNIFEIGMKLEAVDKKNPHLICPATIGDVDEDQVFISFDGWRGTFDYWTTFQSRDIFPVGWCSKNNHVLQSPGLKGDNPMIADKIQSVIKQQKRQTRSLRNSEPIPSKTTTSARVFTKEKPQKRRKLEKSFEKEPQCETPSTEPKSSPAKRRTSCSTNSTSSDESESSNDDRKSNDPTPSDVTSSLKQEQSTISDDNELLHKQTNEIEKQKQNRKLRKQKRQKRRLLKALKRAGNSEDKLTPEQILMLTSPHKIPPEILENELIKAKMKKKKKKRKSLEQAYTRLEGFGVKENTPLTPKSEVPSSPSFFSPHTTPSSLFGVVREATQGWPLRLKVGSVVTSDNKLGTFNCLNTSQEKTSPVIKNSDSIKPTETVAGTTACVSTTTNEPQNKDERATPSPSVTSTTNIGQTNYLSDNGAVSSTTNIDTTSPSPKPPLEAPSDPPNSLLLATPVVSSSRRSRNPLKWSITDTIEFVREKEPALHPYLHLFQKHEIDGAAFLLLSSSNIVKYMALKLGPALKLTSLVESLKTYVERHKQKRRKK